MLKEYLKQYRYKHGFSQKEMANKLNTCQSYYSELETGVRKPGLVMKKRLASLFQVEVDFINNLL